MNLKTTLKTFWDKYFKYTARSPEDIWNDYEKGISLPNSELKVIIEILKHRNILAIEEILRLKKMIDDMQIGFDFSQKRLIQKINQQ